MKTTKDFLMMEQIISAETAHLAKEKKFDWEVYDAYIDYRPFEDVYDQPVNYRTSQNHNLKDNRKSAPTQSLLQKWLREVHGIYCDNILRPNFRYSWEINSLSDIDISEKSFPSYEEALEAGLQEALKLIK